MRPLASIEAMTERERRLVECLRETREACAAAMRVIANLDDGSGRTLSLEQRFVDECHRSGVHDGVGARAEALLDEFGVEW